MLRTIAGWTFRVVLLACLGLAAAFQQPALAQSVPLVIATGLGNPRGLAFGPDGALYVVEAGRGGDSTLCLPEPQAPPGTTRCYGPTGAVTRITGLGMQERVITGLPSLAVPSGEGATGPHDIAFGFGSGWITVGLGGNPAVRAPFEAAGIRLGSLVQARFDGSWSDVVDLSAHEAAANPDGGAVDSNPYGFQVLADRGVYTDAGGNAVMSIALSGAITTLAAFPTRTMPSPLGGTVEMQTVPTTVAQGPDGSLFVGELTGFPFPVGGARVYRVPLTGGTPIVVADGFTNIIDIAITETGVGYVLEHDIDGLPGPSEEGRLTQVAPDGTRTVVATGLVKPGGVAVGPDGALYITNRSIEAGTGEVVRVVP